MRFSLNFLTGKVAILLLAGLFCGPSLEAQTVTLTNVNLRVMAANLTSGNDQSYETPGINIFKGLKPDVVMLQEFNYAGSSASNQLRQLVNAAFGPDYSFFCETGSPAYNIPNGIVSRYPIVTNGSVVDPDTGVNDRGFAWARIRLPGTNDLYVISAHLKSGSSGGPPSDATRRATQATNIVQMIQDLFPAGAWVVVGGDFNIQSSGEVALAKFKTILSDAPIPTDASSAGDANTNEPRSERYDYVLPSFSFTNRLTNVVIGSQSFPKGLVFDSEKFSPLSDVSPVTFGDSHGTGMQHMGVVKDFRIVWGVTNAGIAPVITNQPQALAVTLGSNAAFNVVAGGTPALSYQWRFGTTNIAGATLSTYTRLNSQTNDAGNYSVIVTNAAGSITSSPALLTVIVPPGITASPQPLTVNQGASALFTVIASGSAPLSYQWRFNTTAITGATNSSYTRTNVQPADVGNYFVVVTNTGGSVTSSAAKLDLSIPTPTLTVPFPNVLRWSGLSNLVYTIQVSTNLAGTNWSVLGTASSSTTTITFSNGFNAGQQFYRIVYP